LAKATYECLYLFDSNRYARDAGGCAAAIQDAIIDLGGEILVSRLWAEQKLAYPIKGHQKGTYWLIYFEIETAQLKSLNRTYQLDESLLRWLFTRVDARLVEALVAHAKGKAALPRPEIVIEDDEPVAVGAGVGEDGDEFDAE
jgi:small subunit ribosomal protein S6